MALALPVMDVPPEGRRTDPRLRLQLPARLILVDRACSCVLENISRTGARLIVEQPPELGEFGQMQCEGFELFFETVWCRGKHVGVTFDEPLRRDRLLKLRQFNDCFSDLKHRQIKALARHWVNGEAN